MTDTELNEQLALKAGYKLSDARTIYRYKDGKRVSCWLRPDGKVTNEFESWITGNVPDYTHDLNACFRDIKPLLIKGGVTSMMFHFTIDGAWCHLSGQRKPTMASDWGETESLAFCEAAIKFLSGVK